MVRRRCVPLGLTLDEVLRPRKIDRWFLVQIQDLVREERRRCANRPGDRSTCRAHARSSAGFSDRRLADLLGLRSRRSASTATIWRAPGVQARRHLRGRVRVEHGVHVLDLRGGVRGGPTTNQKIMVLGGGPNRIGQGIEFDYCCVSMPFAMREDGYETIMVNCNPETVSTDYDTSGPSVLRAADARGRARGRAQGNPKGIIVQYGGQTPLKLAEDLEAAGAPIIGTSPDSIDLAEDRERFQKLVDREGLRQPPNRTATEAEQAVRLAPRSAIRWWCGPPTCSVGGRWRSFTTRTICVATCARRSRSRTIAGAARPFPRRRHRGRYRRDLRRRGSADRRHHGAHRAGRRAFRRFGVFAAAVYAERIGAGPHARPDPPSGARAEGGRPDEHAVRDQGDDIYLLEVNPRASRTVPFVSKATGAAAGQDRGALHGRPQTLEEQGIDGEIIPSTTIVKGRRCSRSSSSRCRYPARPGDEIDRRGHGRRARTFGEASRRRTRRQRALPRGGRALLSVREADRRAACRVAAAAELGFEISATRGTCRSITEAGIGCRHRQQGQEGRPHIVDMIKNNEFALIINTTEGNRRSSIRHRSARAALQHKVSYSTTISGAEAAVLALQQPDELTVNSLRELHGANGRARN